MPPSIWCPKLDLANICVILFRKHIAFDSEEKRNDCEHRYPLLLSVWEDGKVELAPPLEEGKGLDLNILLDVFQRFQKDTIAINGNVQEGVLLFSSQRRPQRPFLLCPVWGQRLQQNCGGVEEEKYTCYEMSIPAFAM